MEMINLKKVATSFFATTGHREIDLNGSGVLGLHVNLIFSAQHPSHISNLSFT
jgi:hypothetical protein